MDKPKTLSEQLTQLADWIEFIGNEWRRRHQYAIAEDCYERAEAVRALAERMKGKCIITPFIVDLRQRTDLADCIKPGSSVRAYVLPVDGVGRGDTPEEALANLQALLDEQRGK